MESASGEMNSPTTFLRLLVESGWVPTNKTRAGFWDRPQGPGKDGLLLVNHKTWAGFWDLPQGQSPIFSTYSAKQSHKSFLLQIWPLLLFLDTLSPLWSLHLIILTNWQIIYSFSNSLTISESSALTDDEIRQEISRFTLFRAKRRRYALFLFLLASMLFLRLAQIGALLFIAILFTEHINTQRQKNK